MPEDALAHWRDARWTAAPRSEADWRERLDAYAADVPGAGARARAVAVGRAARRLGQRPAGDLARGRPLATRQASGLALQAIAAAVPNLVGGSADLGGSTGTTLKQGGTFGPATSGPDVPLGRARARDGGVPQRDRRPRRARGRSAAPSSSSPTT